MKSYVSELSIFKLLNNIFTDKIAESLIEYFTAFWPILPTYVPPTEGG